MSQQPQRWNIDANVAPHDAGQWVTWEDYCRLKAENESLTADVTDLQRELDAAFDDVEKQQRDKIQLNEAGLKLKAEVERLRSLFQKVDDCRYNIISCKRNANDPYGIPNDWRADSFNLHLKTLREIIDAAKEVQS